MSGFFWTPCRIIPSLQSKILEIFSSMENIISFDSSLPYVRECRLPTRKFGFREIYCVPYGTSMIFDLGMSLRTCLLKLALSIY